MEKINKIIILIVAIAITLIIVLSNTIISIPTGNVGIKTRFGAVQNVNVQEGINTKIPFIEKIIKIDCKIKKLDVSSESSTKDLQTVNTDISLNYNVNKDTANKLYQEVGTDYEEIIIKPAILESIKSAMAQYTAEELITKRSEVSEKIQQTLNDKISTRGFTITSFNITELKFSESYNKAIEDKAVAQQQVETAKAQLEKTNVENEKKIKEAEAEARIMELQNQQITDKTLELKKLENQANLINKWNRYSTNNKFGKWNKHII